MATNQTANYQLNQWEPTDQVLRTDFNADNAKLDAALAEKAEVETVSALQTAVASKAEQTALSQLTGRVEDLESAPRLVAGVYFGDGAESQFISLGGTPKAVFTISCYGLTFTGSNDAYGGLALTGYPAARGSAGTRSLIVGIETGGFRVYNNSEDSVRANREDYRYHYLAWM